MSRRAVGLLILSLALGPACERRATTDAVASAPATVPPGSEAPASSSVAAGSTVADEVHASVRNRVREGYDDRARIIEFTLDVFSADYDGGHFDTAVAKLVDEELALQRRLEAGWTGPTDCDRLDAAFAALERTGILARQKFSDCGTCGAAEIATEMTSARAAGRSVRGYVFFHDQDVEGVVDDGDIYMSYGSWSRGDAAAVAIGHEIVAALKKAGLTTEWDGRIERRIGVKLDWKKRRFTKAPPVAQ